MLNPSHLPHILAKFFIHMVLRINRFHKAADELNVPPVTDRGTASRVAESKCGVNLMNSLCIFVASVMAISLVFSLSVVFTDLPSDALWTVVGPRNLDFEHHKAIQQDEDLSQHNQVPKINPLDNFLPTGFDKNSCRSRFESVFYRQRISKKASPELISRLRRYEALHKKCGPYTHSYNKTVEDVKFGRDPTSSDCKYIIWVSFSGLGNRILTLASTFLYALLTDRVLLVDRGVDIPDLFCEPFPESSWLLPLDFPLTRHFNGYNKDSKESYGNMLRSNSLSNSTVSYMYVHAVNDYDDLDKIFFCNQDQAHVQNVPWLIMKSDNYFIPYLFVTPYFEQELQNLFPDKEAVFHLLGRYLFHPTNSVWGLITRYYDAYLSKADVKVGIQIRVFDAKQSPFKNVLNQILSCTAKENILPKISREDRVVEKQKTVAVIITSLVSGFFEEIRNMYWVGPTERGEVVSVYQPTHEGHQKSNKQEHNKKAWAEMYLLSLMDKLVTSSWSTFGYVAQALGGLQPWIVERQLNMTVPDPACKRALSMEPCFHAPPYYDCKLGRGADPGFMVPHVKHCEDVNWGIKLVQPSSPLPSS